MGGDLRVAAVVPDSLNEVKNLLTKNLMIFIISFLCC